MSRRIPTATRLALGLSVGLCAAFGAAGCNTFVGVFDSDPPAASEELRTTQHDLDEPDVPPAAPEEVAFTGPARTVEDQGARQTREITLDEALHTALVNNKIVRVAAGVTPNNPLLTNPNGAASIYDPAIGQTGVLFGNLSVEAALANFDAQSTTSLFWSRDENGLNNPLVPVATLTSEAANFNHTLSKAFANGGRFSVGQTVNYLGTSQPGVRFPSSYTAQLEAEYRMPVWAGSGVEFTRIAGPTQPGFGAIAGVSQGVLIARINEDITLADFEANVRNMAYQVELAYWDLYLAYCLYDTAVIARNSALESWRLTKTQADLDLGNRYAEPQARDRYYETRAQVETALSQIYTREDALRQLLGLPVNDGFVLRPADEPTTAKIYPDWNISLAESLVNRVELRRQKWSIKSLELQLKAANSLTNPRLDLVSRYRVNGFGDELATDNENAPFQGAINQQTGGNLTGWTLGFEFSMPLGFRREHTQVRNIELRLAKARQLLAAQELEISHELSRAFQQISVQYLTAQSNYNRLIAALDRQEVLSRLESEESLPELDLWLRAQESVAIARRNYCESVSEYNKALAALHYHKGTTLEHYNVRLQEGSWEPKAYEDAFRRALARTYAEPAKHRITQPPEFGYDHPPAEDPSAAVVRRPQPSGPDGSGSPVGRPEVPGESEPRDVPDLLDLPDLPGIDGRPGDDNLPLDPSLDDLRNRLLDDGPDGTPEPERTPAPDSTSPESTDPSLDELRNRLLEQGRDDALPVDAPSPPSERKTEVDDRTASVWKARRKSDSEADADQSAASTIEFASATSEVE